MRPSVREEFLSFADVLKRKDQVRGSQPTLARGLPFIVGHLDALRSVIIPPGNPEDIIRRAIEETWETSVSSHSVILLETAEAFGEMYPVIRQTYRQFILASLPEMIDKRTVKLARIGMTLLYEVLADYLVNTHKVFNPQNVIMATLTDRGIEAFVIPEEIYG